MRYMLRYGMSVILLVLFTFMGYVLNAIEIDNKVTVDVIMEHDGNLYCYVPNGITMGKHVVVQTTEGKNLSFSFERQQVYKNYTVYVLESDSTMQFPNESDRKISGTVKIGKIKLVNLVFRRWTNLGSLR
nr:hypothetical protein [Prevotella sp.]